MSKYPSHIGSELGKTLINSKEHKEIAKARFVSNDITLSETMTVGMVTTEKTTNIESMIIKADEMLYKGKQSGKNCIVK